MRGKDPGQLTGAQKPIDDPARPGTRLSGLQARRAELVVLFGAIATLGLIAVLLVVTSARL